MGRKQSSGGDVYGDGRSTVSESTVSNTELSELWALTEFWGEKSVSSSHSIVFVCQSELTESKTKLATELNEFPLLKQCSRNSIPPVSYI